MSTDDPKVDSLVRALHELRGEAPGVGDDEGERRARELGRAARAVYVESAEGRSLAARLGPFTARAAMPVVLASIVGVYLVWALSAAVAIVH